MSVCVDCICDSAFDATFTVINTHNDDDGAAVDDADAAYVVQALEPAADAHEPDGHASFNIEFDHDEVR